MSILEEMDRVIYGQEEVTEEGFTDNLKIGAKLLPALATIFQLAMTSPRADVVYKDDIKAALIDMQEATSKDVLDVTADTVQRLIAKMKDIRAKEKMLKSFHQAYHDVEQKLAS